MFPKVCRGVMNFNLLQFELITDDSSKRLLRPRWSFSSTRNTLSHRRQCHPRHSKCSQQRQPLLTWRPLNCVRYNVSLTLDEFPPYIVFKGGQLAIFLTYAPQNGLKKTTGWGAIGGSYRQIIANLKLGIFWSWITLNLYINRIYININFELLNY